jgi:hypothetical protein
MDVTMRKPGVTAPSQIPKNTRHANSPPKLVAEAWQSKATDHTKMLKLEGAVGVCNENSLSSRTSSTLRQESAVAQDFGAIRTRGRTNRILFLTS